MSDAPLPTLAASDVEAALAERATDSADPAVVGVVLAAGTSSRFGEANKLLATVDGDPLVRRAARTLLDANLASVVVVLGHEADAVRAAVADFPVTFVENPDFEAGLSTSVRAGVDAAVAAAADAAVFLPGDMPFVDAATVRLLVDAHRAGLGDAFAAAYEDRRGNPVLFDARHFDRLRSLDGDVGGRRVLLEGDASALVDTDDAGIAMDVDTTSDLDGV